MYKKLNWAIPLTVIVWIMLSFFNNFMSQANTDELTKALQEGAFLVDVRSSTEFAAGSVTGAVNIPLDSLSNHLEAFKGKAQIVVFCQSGNRSKSAKRFLEKEGFTNVLNGGGWQAVQEVVSKINIKK